MDEITKEFLIESHENLDRLDRDLVSLEKDPHSKETLGSIFRTIHTLKGTSGFLGFGKLSDGLLVINSEITTALNAGKNVPTRKVICAESVPPKTHRQASPPQSFLIQASGKWCGRTKRGRRVSQFPECDLVSRSGPEVTSRDMASSQRTQRSSRAARSGPRSLTGKPSIIWRLQMVGTNRGNAHSRMNSEPFIPIAPAATPHLVFALDPDSGRRLARTPWTSCSLHRRTNR